MKTEEELAVSAERRGKSSALILESLAKFTDIHPVVIEISYQSIESREGATPTVLFLRQVLMGKQE